MNRVATENLDNGFRHHGVATPISSRRGTVATVDGGGRNVVLLWLFDHRGGYALLMIDAQTGKAEEFPMPFPFGGDCPYASILSSGNRFYTHFSSHFVEFDPAERTFTFVRETPPRMAMSMTEDDDGRIWSVTYPDSGVVSFDPTSREFRDYGHVYLQNWPQYQRYVAADDTGWLYFGIGNTASQIVALEPEGGEATPLLEEGERTRGNAYVYRDVDGKVYGLALEGAEEAGWYELYSGEGRRIGQLERRQEKPIIAGPQGLFHQEFPDGSKVMECNLVERLLVVEDPRTQETRELRFDYTSEGAHIMGVATAPDGTICGGTSFPMRYFSYDPTSDQWTNRASYGQWNTVARQGDRFFVGGYPGGYILGWHPSQPWVPTEKGSEGCNPQFFTECTPTIHRPHDLLAHPDGRTLILAGTPGYGYTGGGLLFWDRQTNARTVLEHTDILPEHSTASLLPLPHGKLLGGSTVRPGTGGEQKATEAELYILDMESKAVEWHGAVLPGAEEYTDMCVGPDGNVYGFADRKRFYVFDPTDRKVIHEQDTEGDFGLTTSQQGPRVFVLDGDGHVYVLFVKGVARVDPAGYAISMLAESPVPIAPGGDFHEGFIYFGSGSHLYSYRVPE